MKGKLLTVALATTVALPLAMAPTALADDDQNIINSPQNLSCGSNTISFDYGYGFPDRYNHQPNVTLPAASINVPGSLQGKTADVNISVTNLNGSYHPNSDVIVQSGSSSVTDYDTENQSNPSTTTTASGSLNLGSTVDLSIHLGSDGVFSGKGDVTLNVNCPGGQGGGQVLGATTQVVAPTKSVNAGEGGGASKTVALVGLASSLAAAAAGVALRLRSSRNL